MDIFDPLQDLLAIEKQKVKHEDYLLMQCKYENVLVNDLRRLWLTREERFQETVDPIALYEKEQKEKQYRRELRYITQMYSHFQIEEHKGEEYFEFAQPEWNQMNNIGSCNFTLKKRGRPKKANTDIIKVKVKSTWITKLLKWHAKGQKIKTPRQYSKFLHKEYPLKKFKNTEYKLPKKEFKLRKAVLQTWLEQKLCKK